MIFEYLRFSYSAPFRFSGFADDPVNTVYWYVAPPGAKLFPEVHRCGSLIWGGASQASVFGEQVLPRRRWKRHQGVVGVAGQQHCGLASWYRGEGPRVGTIVPDLSFPAQPCCSVPTACCPSVPRNLVLRFRNPTPPGCSGVAELEIPLEYQGSGVDVGKWIGQGFPVGSIGGPLIAKSYCQGVSINDWRVALSGCSVGAFANLPDPLRSSCDPFRVYIPNVLIESPCCSGVPIAQNFDLEVLPT